MAQTVFWSWQSDQPARETRSLIRDALITALGRIAVEMEEAERPEIDHDTKGLAGSPDIVASILKKIESAAVFVADVTPIVISAGDKQVANPNVLIELGYAKRALGTERVITVWNTALTNAKIEDLPFDMRHRRGPIEFAVQAGAPKDQLKKARDQLSQDLENCIRASLRVIGDTSPIEPPWHEADPELPGLWKNGQHPIPVNLGWNDDTEIRTEGPHFAFARLLPQHWTRTQKWMDIIQNGTGHPIPLGRCSGMDYGPTTGGFVIYRSSKDIQSTGVTPTATRFFKETGELWGIASSFFNDDSGTSIFATVYAIRQWASWIKGNVHVATALGGKGPWRLRLGVEGLQNSRWPNRSGHGGSRALEDRVECEISLANVTDETVEDAVRMVFNSVLEAYGMSPFSAEEFTEYATR
jgi:hypothetical protein